MASTIPLDQIGLRVAACCGSCVNKHDGDYEARSDRCLLYGFDIQDSHLCDNYAPAPELEQIANELTQEAEQSRAKNARWDEMDAEYKKSREEGE